MIETDQEGIIQEFHQFINDETYPCVAARAAISRQHLPCLVADHMGCPKDDRRILQFLYDFVAGFRSANSSLYSAAIIFKGPEKTTEEIFDTFLWQRLQSLSGLDAGNFRYDKRVNPDPSASDFSFSLAEEAFFIIGLHPASSRRSRQFKYPAMVFNPHAQFDALRKTNRFEKMKNIVRQRDILYSGSINPMLADFGEASEAYQYSGRQHDGEWTCPLKVMHAETKDQSSPQ
jgi:uncharacterized protein